MIKVNVGVLLKKATLHMTQIHEIYIILSQITLLINAQTIHCFVRIVRISFLFLFHEIKIYGISCSFKIYF